MVTGLIIYIRYREQKLKREKEYLEQVVKERTAEVVAQRDHIEEQHKIVTHQKEEITASITLCPSNSASSFCPALRLSEKYC